MAYPLNWHDLRGATDTITDPRLFEFGQIECRQLIDWRGQYLIEQVCGFVCFYEAIYKRKGFACWALQSRKRKSSVNPYVWPVTDFVLQTQNFAKALIWGCLQFACAGSVTRLSTKAKVKSRLMMTLEVTSTWWPFGLISKVRSSLPIKNNPYFSLWSVHAPYFGTQFYSASFFNLKISGYILINIFLCKIGFTQFHGKWKRHILLSQLR